MRLAKKEIRYILGKIKYGYYNCAIVGAECYENDNDFYGVARAYNISVSTVKSYYNKFKREYLKEYLEVKKEYLEREVNKMDYEMLEHKVMLFILNELKSVEGRSHQERMNSRAIAYGGLMFAEELFPSYNEELADWWRNEVWGKF